MWSQLESLLWVTRLESDFSADDKQLEDFESHQNTMDASAASGDVDSEIYEIS